VDLDDFKGINDRLGHAAGDTVLQTVGQRLRACVRPGDTVARLGGDEFVIVLDMLHSAEAAHQVAERIAEAMRAPIRVKTQTMRVTASIGIAYGGEAGDALLRDADVAMYRAKARLQGLGVPILPRLLHRLAISTAGVFIGDPVIVHPGIHLAHGHIVIDGIAEVHSGVTIFPFVTIGLRAPNLVGPTIHQGVTIGSGAKVLGEVQVGPCARIGANAVVLEDVPAGATAVGVPAEIVREGEPRAAL